MLSFENDYSEGCHPKILEAFARTNLVQQPGYGTDEYTLRAKEKIRAAVDMPFADVWFVNGGTQANRLVIDTMLEPFEGVISARTGHIACHEAGAVEFTGHKVLTLDAHNGKLCAEDVRRFIETFYTDESYEHMVFPGMVYVSQPTEYGTLYTEKELEALSEVCREAKIPLYLDGARLGYALASPENEIPLPRIAQLTDVFYIGGTKVGALSGEAIVFCGPKGAPSHFLTRIKQHGDLSAKGRLIGLQFDTLFTDDLYLELGKNGIRCARKIREIFRRHDIPCFLESPTNQQFFILENSRMEELSKKVLFSRWEAYDDTHTVVRFAASWATSQQMLETLDQILGE